MLKKTTLLIVCLIGVMVSAQAQWSVSPELGISAFRGRSYDWRPGIKAGAAVEYQFKSNFSLESGLYYTQRGYSYLSVSEDFTDNPYEDGFVSKPSLVRHMFQIPVHARFSWKVADDVRLFVGAGPYLGLYFANDWKHTYIHRNDSYGDTAELGLSVMAGIEVKRFFIRLGYEHSFTGPFAYNAATVSFGYKF